MRISDVFVSSTTKPVRKMTKKFFLFGAGITGLISGLIAIVTFYGQFTGLFTLTMQRDAMDKGIELSVTRDFLEPKSTLSIEPMNEIGDMLESDIDVDAARNVDGQFYDERIPYYIAYTYYLRNSGKEMVNISYRLRVIDSYKGVDKAVKIRYIVEDLDTGEIRDKTYMKKGDNPYIIDEVLERFSEGAVKKITIFMWFDGEYTDASMFGGGIKLDMAYSILNAVVE
ncbi:hypothetical protein [Acholeplasma hippikon]|uniref:Uncharacterized protein n=1 Tax=Acholeplasma hippikon TaxID=264636 RepID=A0A449BLK4_9MOLU|nr:hypothetical protein [Acholeplasma hippikon]VEU83324.1 Uncharacterised protein [Acholeplasma hippikon]